jgi:hypothetical protein
VLAHDLEYYHGSCHVVEEEKYSKKTRDYGMLCFFRELVEDVLERL